MDASIHHHRLSIFMQMSLEKAIMCEHGLEVY